MGLIGTVFPTDYGWYDFLRSVQGLEEVNFWTPSAHWTFRAPELSPFFFKLKRPHNAICGFGYFARYAALPDWYAWECFGVANGCESLDALRQRIGRLREGINFRGAAPAIIGCIAVVNVSFFDRHEWIPQPRDWPGPNLRGKRYDLAEGEGARVWQACMERVQIGGAVTIAEAPRFGTPVLIRPRLGQGAFRVSVTDAYNHACAVTGEHSLPVLEAAHIRPYNQQGPHLVRNGLLLRADLHRLFDQGYVTITADGRLEVSRRLRDDYQNGRSYYPLHGSQLVLPSDAAEHPSAEFVEWHNEQRFLG